MGIGRQWSEWRIIDTPLAVDEAYLTTQNLSGFVSAVQPQAVSTTESGLGIVDVMLAFFDVAGNLITTDNNARLDMQVVELVQPPPDVNGSQRPPFLAGLGDPLEFVVQLKGTGRTKRFLGIGFNTYVGVMITSAMNLPTFDKLGIYARYT